MARLFDDAGSEYLQIESNAITAYPFTLAGWGRPDANPDDMSILQVVDKDSNRVFANIDFGTSGLLARAAIISSLAGPGVASSSSSWSINTWHHVTGVFLNATSRTVYLDGGNSGNESTDVPVESYDRMAIGALRDSSDRAYMSGRLGEIAAWDADLTAAEAAILALGYSPMLVRPQSLIAYWRLFGNASPEPDRIGGYNMAVTGAVKAPHPPIIYPDTQLNPFIQQGVTPMGRMYNISAAVAAVTGAIDIARVSAPTDAIVVIHKVIITQETEFGDAAAEQMDIKFHRGSTDGSGGAANTPAPTEVGDAAFGGTAATGNTTQSTEGTILLMETAAVAAGFYWAPTPEEKIVLSPSGRFVAELSTAPDDSIDFRVFMVIEEIGG